MLWIANVRLFVDPYIEVLMFDEGLADMVWELWARGVISDEITDLDWNTFNSRSSSRASLCTLGVPVCLECTYHKRCFTNYLIFVMK
jgi:hypothetical protein